MTDEEANEEVTCPACGGKAFNRPFCTWCDRSGTVSRWVAQTITSETGEIIL